ncbi:MAG: NAD-dependent epimerase/dehydratase family protein [Candidatus Methanoperedens sp.]|nr:NAD-dependent epimerase/dehydratase family protein [Candidatus Methanoperedens sp.]MCZ7384241.1 NAD-dependent epimerase/dehydratase family protein [Candidatus Methanoperedens sp.]
MKALVTGGTGFIGSHLVDSLVSKGHEVRVLLRKKSNTKYLENLDVEKVYSDLNDKNSLKKAVENVDVVFHLGAIFNYWVPRDLIFDVNVNGTKNILDACLDANIDRFVHCSTIGVMGPTGTSPVNETAPYNPGGSTYTQSKCEAEKLVLKYYAEQKLPVTVIRPAVVYGPRCFYGMYDGITAAANGKLSAILGPGDNYVSLVYVSDVVQGFELAAGKEKAVGEIYIIADERPQTLNELFITMAKVFEINPPKRHVPVQVAKFMAFIYEMKASLTGGTPMFTGHSIDFMMTNHAYDISKAKLDLGYESKISFEEGLKRTIDFYRENGYIR